ncbi:MAG: glycosyltransferase [Syntrophobacteraceae bacterium]
MEYGGAQRLLGLLARFTPKASYRVVVCALQRNAALKQRIESEGAEVIVLGRARPSVYRPLRFLAYVLGSLRDVRRICRERRVETIQCHLSDAEFVGIIAGAICGSCRVVTTVHYPELLPYRLPGEWRNRLRIVLTRLLYRRWADSVIAVSTDVAQKLEEVFLLEPAKVHVVVNRIDVQAFQSGQYSEELRRSLGLRPEDRLLVTVGRLAPPKGQAFLLEALAILARKHETLRLMLVGDGELKDSLEAICRRLSLTDRVIFAGNREDVADILAMAELFVLPSLSEGTSLALLEAMAGGKPVVATDIPGNRSVIERGKSGLLAPPGDAAALADAIDQLLDHPDRAKAMGQNAHALAASHYDIRETVRELERVWKGEGAV